MKIRKNEVLFFIGIICLYIINMSGTSILFTLPDIVLDIILMISFVCFSIQTIIKTKDKKMLFIYSAIVFINIIIYYNSKQSLLLTLTLVIIATQRINIKKVIKFLFVINLFSISLHILIYVANLIFEFIDIKYIYRGDMIRHAFLFAHPNTFSGYIFWELGMYTYLKYNNLYKSDYILLMIFCAFIYIFPNTKTVAINLVVLTLLLFLFTKSRFDINNKIFRSVVKNLSIIIMIFFVIAMLAYPYSNLVKTIDRFFSSRIKLGSAAFKEYEISLFGQKIEYGNGIKRMLKYGLTTFTIDSSYYFILCNMGIIATFAYVYAMQITMKNLYKKKRKKEILLFIILIIYSTMETWCLNPIIGFPLLFISKNFNFGKILKFQEIKKKKGDK